MINTKSVKLSVAVILIASLAACSSSSDDNSPTTPGGTPPVVNPPVGGTETGILPVILDRMGRPGVSTALVADNDDKDDYNLEGDPANWAGEFTDEITSRVTIIDGLDGVMGNALLNPSTLTALLVDDRLRINTSIPECDIYLALEIALGGCGGRTLERDVINDTLQHLVSQMNPVDDLADNDSVFESDWPFLGVAN